MDPWDRQELLTRARGVGKYNKPIDGGVFGRELVLPLVTLNSCQSVSGSLSVGGRDPSEVAGEGRQL